MAIAKRIPLLTLILLVGLLLRFWNLEQKPLWMDEAITALFSFGRNYYDVPVEQTIPVAAFNAIFTLNSTATCAQITQTVMVQSVHPPLFFCWMHTWLSWINVLPVSWVWQLRSLPALFGVVAIAAIYQLNSLAISRKAGLIGASIMAVSPFAVYLSQEARHYTLPMVFVILALTALYQMLVDLRQRQFHPLIWLGWVGVNSLGFYVHYFFLLAFTAQVVILIGEGINKTKGKGQPFSRLILDFLRPLLAIALVCLTYLPWVPTLLSHVSRPETDWVKGNAPGVLGAIAPLFQLVSGWTLATIALPVERQPIGLAIVSGSLMAVFSGWLAWRVGRGLWQLWRNPATRLGTRMLVMFAATVMLEFLAIAYLLGKDFTQVPRYNFIYFPAICALIGAGLSYPVDHGHLTAPDRTPTRTTIATTVGHWFDTALVRTLRTSRIAENPVWVGVITRLRPVSQRYSDNFNRRAVTIVLGVATFSSVLVIANQVFQKPYQPEQVASTLLFEPQRPTLVTMAYRDFQDIALGLSFGLELGRQYRNTPHSLEPQFAFMGQFDGYEGVWRNLSLLPQPLPFPLNLWVIGPGLKRVGYRQELILMNQAGRSHPCTIDPNQHYRIGIPYQLYRCQ